MPKRKQHETETTSSAAAASEPRRRVSRRRQAVRIKVEPPSCSDPSVAKLAAVTPDICASSSVQKQPGKALVLGGLFATSTTRPTQYECQWAVDALARLHPEVVQRNKERRREFSASCGDQDTILDGVVSTMLSQNTTSANSTEAFRRLKHVFPTWESYMQGDTTKKVKQLEESIRVGGLSAIKADRIHAMLETLQEERGTVSLEFLRDLSDEGVKSNLLRFKGLGPKTISCVLLFAMGRPDFPVDTHVHRITKSIGWVGSSCTAEGAYEHLNSVVPDGLKLDLHCLLIAHGKACHRCAARGKPQFPPKDGSKLTCPLVQIHKTQGLKIPQVKVLDVVIKQEKS